MRHSLQHSLVLAPLPLGVMIFVTTVLVTAGCGQPKSTTEANDQSDAAVAQTAVAQTAVAQTKDAEATNEGPSASTSTEASAVAADSDSPLGVLSGRITLDGAIPSPRKIQITKDAETCGAAGTVQDVFGEAGGVGNVVIEIGGVKSDAPWEWTEPKEGYAIRQKDCQFTPNMIVVPIGKEISVYNDDPIGHNVNTGAWNQMQPAGPDPIVKPVEEKTPVKIVCNIHSWMEGWICPVQSPFYAVTDMKGNYQIKDVPPGKYRITIWHPYLGRKNERMTFEPGKTMTVDHQYKVPKS